MNCNLTTKQRMNRHLCRSRSCEPCIEFRKINLAREIKEKQDVKINKLENDLDIAIEALENMVLKDGYELLSVMHRNTIESLVRKYNSCAIQALKKIKGSKK